MEAATPPPPPPPQAPPPQAPPPPAAPSGGATWPAYLVAILFALVGIFFAIVSISLAGDEICEDAIAEAQRTGQLFVDCVEKTSGNKIATVIAGALTALASLWAVIASFGVGRGSRPWGSLGAPVGAAIVLAIITVVL